MQCFTSPAPHSELIVPEAVKNQFIGLNFELCVDFVLAEALCFNLPYFGNRGLHVYELNADCGRL